MECLKAVSKALGITLINIDWYEFKCVCVYMAVLDIHYVAECAECAALWRPAVFIKPASLSLQSGLQSAPTALLNTFSLGPRQHPLVNSQKDLVVQYFSCC